MTKRTLIHALQKYLLNPPVKLLFALGIGRPGYALLETIGRKSGKPRRTPVDGMQAGYVRNIERHARVRLKVRNGLRMTWLTGTAHLLPGDDPRERQRWLARARPGSSSTSAVVRLMGTQLLTVRIDLDEP